MPANKPPAPTLALVLLALLPAACANDQPTTRHRGTEVGEKGTEAGERGTEAGERGTEAGGDPALVWSKVLFYQPKGDYGPVALALDAAGELTLAGRLRRPAGRPALFLSRVPRQGRAAWSRIALAADWHPGVALSATDDGDLLLAASCRGTTELGAGTLGRADRWSLLLVRLDAADGRVRWQRAFALTACRVRPALAVGADGAIVLAGAFDGRIDFGAEPLTAEPAGDLFAVRLSAAGRVGWQRRLEHRGPEGLAGLALAADGRMHMAGWRAAAGGPRYGALIELDAAGRPQPELAFRATIDARLTGLVHGPDGARYVAGSHRGTLRAGGRRAAGPLGRHRCFAARLQPDGTPDWLRSLAASGDCRATALGLDRRLGLVLAGRFSGELDIGPEPLPAPAGPRLFALRLEPRRGLPLWGTALGRPAARARTGAFGVDGLVVDAAADLVLAGDYQGSFPRGGGGWHRPAPPYAVLFKLRPAARAGP